MATIMLAEDEAVLRMLIGDTLEDEGHELDIACDGEEALQKIAQNEYDLIILDYMMPKLTGFEVLQQIKQMDDKKAVKVLILSAKSQHAEQEKMRAAGADDFMPKPFSPMDLVRKVEEMLA
ncbi:response regulator [Brevibacillus formosus]|uniref:response regulator transcription factor n=1 Tax=Brevibacillus TaxID=55080 RepID=UPI000D10A978|nr:MULTISPECIES: response regulator [Brevibacillus]MBG9942594.1 histidine kinase [Brevibacillus formosus]MBW5471230.1 response regulator [Brevibacillus formosus]MED1945827.1 response regulator [Brevibacillus formosus]MED2001218.1 response regulator [Brevibacillus formosus]MED2085176.1 response regulator [Brevibacillus formosus]